MTSAVRTNNGTKVLTAEQRDFAAKHHDKIVYGYLSRRRLNRDAYYDVVIFGYLQAVQRYLERRDLREKYTFSTIAYRKMNDALYDHWAKEARPMRSATVLSFNASVLRCDIEGWLRDYCVSIEEQSEVAEDWRVVMRLLTDMELELLRKRIDGYTYLELAKEAGISNNVIRETFDQIREKILTCSVMSMASI